MHHLVQVLKKKKVHLCEPIPDYNKTKVTEKIIQSYKSFKHFIIRPSTLYGESRK